MNLTELCHFVKFKIVRKENQNMKTLKKNDLNDILKEVSE